VFVHAPGVQPVIVALLSHDFHDQWTLKERERYKICELDVQQAFSFALEKFNAS
jgi:hypothetical protein